MLPAEHPATQIALGAVIENLVQAAAAIGLPFDAVAVKTAAAQPIAELTVDTAAAIPHDAHSLPLFGRHTNRFPYASSPLPASLLQWASGQREGSATCLVWEDRKHIRALSRLVRQASEARFQTQEIHEWLGQSLRFTSDEVARGDGLDVATLHLPPGGRQMLRATRDWKRMRLFNRFGAYKGFARAEAAAVSKAPALLAILAARHALFRHRRRSTARARLGGVEPAGRRSATIFCDHRSALPLAMRKRPGSPGTVGREDEGSARCDAGQRQQANAYPAAYRPAEGPTAQGAASPALDDTLRQSRQRAAALKKIRLRKRSLLPKSRGRATNRGRSLRGAGFYEPRIVSECYSLGSTVRLRSIALPQPIDKSASGKQCAQRVRVPSSPRQRAVRGKPRNEAAAQGSFRTARPCCSTILARLR